MMKGFDFDIKNGDKEWAQMVAVEKASWFQESPNSFQQYYCCVTHESHCPTLISTSPGKTKARPKQYLSNHMMTLIFSLPS
jgi:hypothetical protein